MYKKLFVMKINVVKVIYLIYTYNIELKTLFRKFELWFLHINFKFYCLNKFFHFFELYTEKKVT